VVAVDSRARRPRLLVLGAGAAQLGLLEAARARGLFVVAADADPGAPGLELADEAAAVSTEDEAAVERLARSVAAEAIVSPGGDWPVGVAARVAARLGLPHPLDPATAAVAISKSRQRERFAADGVPHARALDPRAPALPCVVKAPDRQGQRGLTLVRGADELPAALEDAAAASRDGGVLVEELVHGPELTVNALSLEGRFVPLTVTDRLTAEPPAFGVALAHAWPSEHDAAAAAEAARAAVEAVGVRAGPTYTQVRLSADGPRVMEVAARLGGGHDAELCEAALGVDLNGAAIDAALGTAAPGPWNDQLRGRGAVGGACVVFLVAPPGRLLAVEGVAAAEALPGIRKVRVYRRAGWAFGPLRRGADRAGAVLAVGDSRDDALERARRAAETIRFHVDADAS
jgi:biotin carboxylase